MKETKKENIFKRLLISLGKPEAKILVFFAGILILSWPFAASVSSRPLYFPFIYFFSAWLALIFFLFISHLKDNNNGN